MLEMTDNELALRLEAVADGLEALKTHVNNLRAAAQRLRGPDMPEPSRASHMS